MKVLIKTYGCQMNERDSEALGAMLCAAGYELTDDETQADVLLFNTCSVRDAAERKAKGKIGYLKKLKDRRPEIIMGVMGCMAQRLGDKLLEELPHLDFVLGTGQLHRLVPLLESIREDRRQVAEVAPSEAVLTGMGDHLPPRWNAQIAITRGCNRFCSYCIVPYVRGREISRSQQDVVEEAKRLVSSGARELLLLGQNVAAYGLGGDTRPPAPDHSPFAELLKELDELPELLRVRFTSPYVSYFNKRLIEVIAASRTVCHNIHLPLQSGSNRILRAMNRQYTAESFLEKVHEIRSAIPDVTFSTDVIVGFPGETGEDFEATRQLMQQIGFEQAFIFKYSPRPGAKSAALEDSVSDEVKLARNNLLLDDLKERIGARLRKLEGSTVEVLTEGVSARNAERWVGRTGTNFVVHFEPRPNLRVGTLRKVRITRTGAVSVFGELI